MNRKNLNGSFNITVNGLPYNTIQGDKYYNETVALFNSNPELFEIEEIKEISIEELRYNKKQELKQKRDKYKNDSGFSSFVYENLEFGLVEDVNGEREKWRAFLKDLIKKYDEFKEQIENSDNVKELELLKIEF